MVEAPCGASHTAEVWYVRADQADIRYFSLTGPVFAVHKGDINRHRARARCDPTKGMHASRLRMLVQSYAGRAPDMRRGAEDR